MKKLLYIVCIIGLLTSLQSCDRVGGWLGDNTKNQQEQTGNDANVGSSDNAEYKASPSDSINAANLQSQIQQKDSAIKALTDSLSVVKYDMETMRNEINKKQADLEHDKVGVKNLFVYLTIFTLLFVVLIVFLVKKLVAKSNLTDNDVKGIIEDMAHRHPEIVCANVYPILTQHANCINDHAAQINSLRKRVDELVSITSRANRNGTANQSPAPTPTGSKPVKESKVFYMKRPQKDMEFDMSLKCLTANEETFYRFEIDAHNPNLARFTFDCGSSASVRWAFTTKDITLDRVCHASGNGNNGKYKCTSAGEAKLQNGKWIVTRKAVVFFD